MSKSVTRRIIAVLFSACGAGVLTLLSLNGSSDALIALTAIMSSIIGFYFGAKATQL